MSSIPICPRSALRSPKAKAGSVMCAYNGINGEPACANEFLLQDQFRGKWNFQGYVVSDCGAVVDIYDGHHFKPTQPEASAISLERGMDNECVDGGFRSRTTATTRPISTPSSRAS